MSITNDHLLNLRASQLMQSQLFSVCQSSCPTNSISTPATLLRYCTAAAFTAPFRGAIENASKRYTSLLTLSSINISSLEELIS